jgi:mannose-6-phosphate isomerase-like protein (cupin superfamily)
MTALANLSQRRTLDPAYAFDITGPKARLCVADGGCEIVHESTRFQICVYALVAPEPEHKRMNADDTLYIVLEGSGILDVDGEKLELREGHAAFVPAGANHRFSAYEHLTVLTVLERDHQSNQLESGDRDDPTRRHDHHRPPVKPAQQPTQRRRQERPAR